MNEETNRVVVEPNFELSAVKDGAVVVRVSKAIVWPQVTWNYSKFQFGPTLEPAGVLPVRIPVEGAEEGMPISADQLATIFRTVLESLLPTCQVFVEAAATDFGYEPKQEVESDF